MSDEARFRSTRSDQWLPVATQVVNGTALPVELGELIAFLAAADTQFIVWVNKLKYWKCGIKITLSHSAFSISLDRDECVSSTTPRLSYFATIGDLARQDRISLRFDSCENDSNIFYFFNSGITPAVPGTAPTHEHLSYFSDRAKTQKLANDVLICDLPAVDDDGLREIYRRIQRPFVVCDVSDPWCCGVRSGPPVCMCNICTCYSRKRGK